MRSGSNLPQTVKAKKVMKACPFGDYDVPRAATRYLKIKFPDPNVNKLRPDSRGASFSRVFGTKTAASEALCVKRKLNGPGWVGLTNAVPLHTSLSHANFALDVPNPGDVCVAVNMSNHEAPPVTALCVNIKAVFNKAWTDELVANGGYSFDK